LYNQKKGPSEKDIMDIKKRLIFKTLTQQGVNALKEAYRKGFVVASPYLVNHLIELQYLKHTNTISSFSDDNSGASVDVDAIYELTDEGKRLAEKWGIK